MDSKRNKWDQPHEGLNILYDDYKQIGYLMQSATQVTSDLVNFMIRHGRGLVYVCLTEERAYHLGMYPQMNFNPAHSSVYKTLGVSIDFHTTTTGISASERADTIKAVIDPKVISSNFKRPGHLFPLISKNGGLSERLGIAEAANEVARRISGVPVAFVCEILNILGDIASFEEVRSMSSEYDMPFIKFSELPVNQTLKQLKYKRISAKISFNRSNISLLR
jgi:3,4-dihydroxy 2-butanone 4-phosphate synthase/GTP cyclohydrolase II